MSNRSTISDYSVDQDISSEQWQVQSFVKQMLRGRIFVGSFREKRYVDHLGDYRDIVQIGQHESDLIKDIKIVAKRLQEEYQNKWIGITEPNTIGAPVGHCLWVELQEEILGSYWYKIKTIRFRQNEVLILLKQVRPIETVREDTQNSKINFEVSAEEVRNIIMNNMLTLLSNISHVMTWHNIVEIVKFIFVLLVTICTCTIHVSKYLAEFSLRLLRETSIFMNSVTPIVKGVLQMVEKIIGGFYILIAMIWKDSRRPPTQLVSHRANMLTYRENKNNQVNISEIYD